jgi:hypothetical protein
MLSPDGKISLFNNLLHWAQLHLIFGSYSLLVKEGKALKADVSFGGQSKRCPPSSRRGLASDILDLGKADELILPDRVVLGS